MYDRKADRLYPSWEGFSQVNDFSRRKQMNNTVVRGQEWLSCVCSENLSVTVERISVFFDDMN